MTRLVFLPSSEHKAFDAPPRLTQEGRTTHFVIVDQDIKRMINGLGSPTNKVGFLLQLGYFDAAGKFFVPKQYRRNDIKFVKQLLNITGDIDLARYESNRMLRHRSRILALRRWTAFSGDNVALLAERVQLLAQQQLRPEQVFRGAYDFCWEHHIEVPTHHQLSSTITDSFNIVEANALSRLTDTLNDSDCRALDALITVQPGAHRPYLTILKYINQALKIKDIQRNVSACQSLANYFNRFQSVIEHMTLGDPATEYYAIWVQKAKITQLKQFPNPTKLYLHLLAYLKHHYFVRQDALVDIFLQCVRSAANGADRSVNTTDKSTRAERRKAVRAVTKSGRNYRHLVIEIARVVRSKHQTYHERIVKLQRLLDDFESSQDPSDVFNLPYYEDLLNRDADNAQLYEALDARSVSLQRKVSAVVKTLVFDEETSETAIHAAITYYQRTDGHIGHAPPCEFLPAGERSLVGRGASFRTSLYKILLFLYAAEAIRAGKLNVHWSYRYRAIHDYLIPEVRWNAERERLLQMAGLTKFADGPAVLGGLKRSLDAKYCSMNERLAAGENPYLSVDGGKVHVSTSATDWSDEEYVPSLLKDKGLIPLLQVLRDINQITEFTRCFKHLSVKHSRLKPSPETIFAGIMGTGCNLGIDTLAHISKGINDNTLKNTVNWCFNLKNIQTANNRIIGLIDKLALPNAFRHYPDQQHTSSDGRKVNVTVASLLATYSFKYFGKEKGVAMYTFIDERHCLFHSTVISASDREAAYVIDGLMQNDVVQSDIHSTDQHGFTECIFAATHFIDTAFAPRVAKIGNQTLYGFSTKSTYQKRGYAIVPSRTIRQKLILEKWDDVLRFMATIKLRYATASQLFKRLSSYAKHHPLYQALKEFGRIIKSQFILTYCDELELRQRIEGQLSKIEQANKFQGAVCFSKSGELQVGTKEQQEQVLACTVLMQNSIVLWNYLSLSQRLSNATNDTERETMLTAITRGSIICWSHLNMQGEYDFRQEAANDAHFDLEKILAFKLA